MNGAIALVSICLISFVALYTTLAISTALEISTLPKQIENPSNFLRTTLSSKRDEALSRRCQHTVSNGNVVADEHGNVCGWSDMDPLSGCCLTDDANAACLNCDDRSCCAVYENCVACCVRNAPAPAFAACSARCRTHSGSVSGAREFSDPLAKHCFGSFAAPAPQFDRFVQLSSAAPSGEAPRRFALSFALCAAIALPIVIFR
jgi:hypothetical protein